MVDPTGLFFDDALDTVSEAADDIAVVAGAGCAVGLGPACVAAGVATGLSVSADVVAGDYSDAACTAASFGVGAAVGSYVDEAVGYVAGEAVPC